MFKNIGNPLEPTLTILKNFDSQKCLSNTPYWENYEGFSETIMACFNPCNWPIICIKRSIMNIMSQLKMRYRKVANFKI